jgi:hypothetical protein
MQTPPPHLPSAGTSLFAHWKEENERKSTTNKTSTALLLPRSDMGVSKILLESKKQRRLVTEPMAVGEGGPASCSHTPSTSPAAAIGVQQSTTSLLYSTAKPTNKEKIENPGIKVYIVMYFGISLVIIMVFLLMKGSWKGKMREFLDMLSSSYSHATPTVPPTKTKNEL